MTVRDNALTGLRIDALVHAGVVGALLTVSLALATGEAGLTVAQGLTSLALYVGLAILTVGALAAHLPQRRFGLANTLTLARGAMVVTLAGFLSGPIDAALSWIAALLGLVAIALDGVDGWLARRYATASPFGARFDMEVDAFLMLILGLLLVASGTVGAWVLLIGLARYLFVAAGWLAPALRAPLPYSERRRAVCVFQGVAMALALVPILSPAAAMTAAAAGLLATAWSFGIDILYLLRAPVASAD